MGARRLVSRRARRETGLFLAEGAQAVREALATPEVVVEVFATADALARHRALLHDPPVAVGLISDRAAATLSETVNPQGLVAVCRLAQPTIEAVLAGHPRLVVLLVEPNDPGNLGTIIRTADAFGADAVVVDGGADPYNGKAVRASAGSLFHLPVLPGSSMDTIQALHVAQVQTFATSGQGAHDLEGLDALGVLGERTAWVFGNEARGLAAPIMAAARRTVRVPIWGRAESLNLSCAAAVCLYASARAQRRATGEAIDRSAATGR